MSCDGSISSAILFFSFFFGGLETNVALEFYGCDTLLFSSPSFVLPRYPSFRSDGLREIVVKIQEVLSGTIVLLLFHVRMFKNIVQFEFVPC